MAVGFSPMALLPRGGLSHRSTASLRRAGPAVPWAAVWQGQGGGWETWGPSLAKIARSG